jgi:hypothetical protein
MGNGNPSLTTPVMGEISEWQDVAPGRKLLCVRLFSLCLHHMVQKIEDIPSYVQEWGN